MTGTAATVQLCKTKGQYLLTCEGVITSLTRRWLQRNTVSFQKTENEGEAESDADQNSADVEKVPIIDPETSRRYMQSTAYKSTYGDEPVWVPYRRNHKGQIPPEKTRKSCIRAGVVTTGNPCPICRDEYLVLHHTNVDLLKQFISPHSGEVIHFSKTGVCQKKFKTLLVTVEEAIDKGYIEMSVPFRKYDYSQYYPDMEKKPS